MELTHNTPFEVKFSLGEIGRIFPIKIRNLNVWKMLIDFRFPDG